jgi:hypothetical protein
MTLTLGHLALAVSLSVGFIAYSQMRIASAKAKLDLYNKRFAIYAAALDYYWALWNEHDSVTTLSPALTKAYRESQFLFAGADGIYEILGKIQQHGANAKLHHEEIKKLEAPPIGNLGSAHGHRRSRSIELSGYESELKKLERQIAKYLAFTSVAGWSVTGLLDRKPASLDTSGADGKQ